MLGRAYADVLDRPRLTGLMRTIIAEGPRFPELRARTFDFGTLPVPTALRTHLRDAGVTDHETATTQYLGMIATAVFWPRLPHGTWSITPDEREHAIREEAQTLVARFR